MFTIDRWDDLYGDEMYITVGLNMKECVDAKRNATSGLTYIMDCANGFEVYTVDSEDGARNLTDAEREEVFDWITEQFDIEKMMDDLHATYMNDRKVDFNNRELQLINDMLDVCPDHELEMDYWWSSDDKSQRGWWAYDYNGSEAVPIEDIGHPLITDEEIEKYNVSVYKCFDAVGCYVCG